MDSLLSDIMKAAESLPRRKTYNLVANPMLKEMQMVIFSGGNVCYSPDLSSGDVRVIELPEIDYRDFRVDLSFYEDKQNPFRLPIWPTSTI